MVSQILLGLVILVAGGALSGMAADQKRTLRALYGCVFTALGAGIFSVAVAYHTPWAKPEALQSPATPDEARANFYEAARVYKKMIDQEAGTAGANLTTMPDLDPEMEKVPATQPT